MNNKECRIRPEIVNFNSNEPIFYSYGIKLNRCSGSCNNIHDPYAKFCVPVVNPLWVKSTMVMQKF